MRKTMLAGAATGVVAAFAFGSMAHAATTQVVRQSNVAEQAEDTPPTASWVEYRRNAGDATFTTADNGSLRLSTPTGADKVTVFNFDHTGTLLSDVDEIGYAVDQVSAGVPVQVAAINLQVDANGSAPGGFTTLVYEPVYNGGVQPGLSTYDAYDGGDAIWWSSNPIAGAPNRDTFVSWSTIVADNPAAVIIGGVGVNQGSGNPALVSDVDTFSFDGVHYDFTASPASKDDCKKGGFASYGYANQGQCVSATNH